MDKLFLQIINMSITSSYVIMFVIVIRLLLKRFPKIFSYALWSVVLFRLIFPFSIEGIFSLIPVNVSSVPADIVYTAKPEINSGIAVIDNSVNNILPPATPISSANPMQIWIFIGEAVWLIGIFTLIVYSIYTTVKLYRNLRNANHIIDNIYETDKFKTPFVFGIVRPKIFLPANLSETEKTYISLHEQTHIKRFDQVIKLISFLVTCIHWFNPLVWIAFFLMSEDMELSCDESVIKKMGNDIKKEYSSSLLFLSTGRRIIGGCPIAFGENNTKGRIKNVLNYKKHKLWVIAVVVIVIIILAVGLLTNPHDDENIYKIDKTKVVRITRQSFPNEVGDIEELDQKIWADLIEEINSGKWSDLSEENFPDVDDISLNITITLARDDSVDNKEYILAIYRNKDKNFLGKEHEYSLALAYDNLNDNIKIWSLPQESYYKIRDILNSSNGHITVEDYAWEFIDNVIENFNNTKRDGYKIIDKKITKLEKLSTFDNLLTNPVELWTLEYRLKPENIDKVLMAGGMQNDDGWLTEDSSMGKPSLVFTYEDDRLIYLGNAYTSEFDINSLSTQEIAIRIMLESKGLLPNETYAGNHAVIKFPLSTGETCQLLLSQPVIQGNTGIWAVERWMDGNGVVYHEVPNLEGDIKIQDYYTDLQDEVDNGHKPWMIDPAEVGYDYIFNHLGQTFVKIDELQVINPATIEDFLNTPVSHYIGYITKMTMDKSLFHLDKVEFLTQEDTERAEELNIDINTDMPSGFYIYNNDNYPMAFEVYDGTEYLILDSVQLSEHISVSKKEFIEYNDAPNNNPLFHIYTKDGYVTRIEEQYIP